MENQCTALDHMLVEFGPDAPDHRPTRDSRIQLFPPCLSPPRTHAHRNFSPVSRSTQMQAFLLRAGEHPVNHKEPQSVGDWLMLCGIDLSKNEIPWPLDKLDRLPNLRACNEETYNQCIAWHIFRSDATVRLPSFEELVPTLNIGSCGDAWLLEKRIKLKEARFADFKVGLLEGGISKIRLLNVPVKKKMVKQSLQVRYRTMVG